MKKIFWDGHYNFMWMMFVGIVGIKSDVFVNFVSKGKEYKRKMGIRIAENILSDKRKRLHVFQCYMEAKSSAEAPDVISDMFKDGKINIKGVKLLPHHISSLMTYMSNPSMQWNALQLNRCNITDIGMSVLEQFISEKTSTLEYVDLSDNNSSPWGVYCAIIRHCSVDSLTLCGDKGIEDYVNEIKDCLQMKTKLISLKLCNITDIGAINIAEAIQMSSTLQNINISNNDISTEGLIYFLEAVKSNCTLQVVNITHNNVTRSGSTSIKQCIENLQHPMQISASWNEINEKGELVAKIITSCAPDNIEENVWYGGGDHLALCLSKCLKEDDAVQVVNYRNINITNEGAIKIAEAIKVNKTLQKLDFSGNNISDHGAAAISDALKSNNSLQILNMSFNKITSKGAIKIVEAIKVNKTIQELDNNISDDEAAAISDALKSNNSLQILKMSSNEITSKGAIKIFEVIKVNKTLQELEIWGNNISDDGAAAISDALKSNNSLQILNISFNKITSKGAIKIFEVIRMNKTMQEFEISSNNISDDGAAAISDALKSNNSLQILNMSYNKITGKGAKFIAEAIKVNTTLHTLNLCQSNINNAVSFDMSVLTAVYHNNTLMTLTLPYVFNDDDRLVRSEVEKINKERTRQGISTLTCIY